jgi:hypothetical protein
MTSWKAFWIGVGTALGAIISGLGLIAVVRRKTKPATPAAIAHEAEVKIEQTRIDIKNDSDKELAARFNTLAKKQTRKKDER